MGYPIDFKETLRMYPNKDGVLEESYILAERIKEDLREALGAYDAQ